MINDLYRMEDKQVETLFSFDEEVLKKALKNIYSKDFHPMTDIEENLFEATWKTMNKATDKGFGTRKTDDPDYDFYREIRMNNAVFAAFKVHRAQNDMAALLLDKNGSLKPFEQWVKEAMPIADHQMIHWLRTEYTMDRILTEGRTVIRSDTQRELEETIRPYDMGITLLDVNFQAARPPEEVKAAYPLPQCR